MLNPEQEIKEYIDNFYEPADLRIMAQSNSILFKDDTTLDDNTYKIACGKILTLLNNSKLADKYRIEIDTCCTALIQSLFKTYVDKDTFVVTSSHDHQATTDQLRDSKRYIISLFRLVEEKNEIFKELYTAFKESGCKKIFCIMIGTAPQATITIEQNFFIDLKKFFVQNNLEHIMILDDCQSMFIIERNYEVFDGFLATGHVLSGLFPDLGILFTKLPQKIGYRNKQALIDLYSKFNVLHKYKDKASQFNTLLNNYFKTVLDKYNFSQYNNEAPHQFAIALPKTINNVKYDEQFKSYGILFNPINTRENFVRIRYHEAILQDSDYFINGLKKLKTHLVKLARFKELTENVQYSHESRVEEKAVITQIELNPKITNLITAEQNRLIYERLLYPMRNRTR